MPHPVVSSNLQRLLPLLRRAGDSMVTPRAEVKGALALQLGGNKEAVKLWKEAMAPSGMSRNHRKTIENHGKMDVYPLVIANMACWKIAHV